MSSTSAESGTAGFGGAPDLRAMNEQMVDRLLASEPDPVPTGGYGLRVLEVAGRHSGTPHRTPVGLLDVDGDLYLVCPDRTRDWPSNLAASGHGAILGGRRRDHFSASELHGSAAARAVAAYLSVVTAPWAVRAFGLPDHPTVEQIEPELDRMAVFALTPRPDRVS